MPVGLSVALALLAPAASTAAPSDAAPHVYGPEAAAAPEPKPSAAPAERVCAPTSSDPNAKEIVVCAVRPQGYRIDPDVLEAKRAKKAGAGSRPHNPHEAYADRSCATIGPMGCRGVPTINLLAVAATAAEISKRLAKGEEIGSLFETEPTSSEYQLYVEAKKRREAAEDAKAAAKAKEKAAAAAAAEPPKDTAAAAH